MIPHGRFPELANFLGAYFHQDWMCDDADWSGVIQRAVAGSTPRYREKVAREIDELLQGQDEESIRRFVHEDSLTDFDPSLEGLTTTEWLGLIARALRGEP